MFGKRIGVDLGTANVLVYVRGRGIVIKEPSVVAVAQRDNSIVAVGGEALDMLGRTPAAISVIRPMRDGVIADYLTTEAMLRYFIGKVVGRLNFIKPEVMVCMPAGVTSVEQRAVRDAAEAAGARRPAHLVPEPLAAAIGARIPVGSPRGHMVVDIGGGRTEAAVISMYGIVVSESVRVAGDRLDEAIANYIKRRHNLLIGDRTRRGGEDRRGQRPAAGRGADHRCPRPRPDQRPAQEHRRHLAGDHPGPAGSAGRDPGRHPLGAGAHAPRAVLGRRGPRHRPHRRRRPPAQHGPPHRPGDRHPLLGGGEPHGVRGRRARASPWSTWT